MKPLRKSFNLFVCGASIMSVQYKIMGSCILFYVPFCIWCFRAKSLLHDLGVSVGYVIRGIYRAYKHAGHSLLYVGRVADDA